MNVVYERQSDAEGERRRCGAAALAMALGGLGIAVSQERLWPLVARPDAQNRPRAFAHRLAWGALQHQAVAVVLRLRDDWNVLRRVVASGKPVVVNHRLHLGSASGHFSLVVGIDETTLTRHDPLFGPNVVAARDEFLSLWRPTSSRCEILGQVVIVVALPGEAPPEVCATCGQPWLPTRTCRRCGLVVGLSPWQAVGCPRWECPAANALQLFCPQCDRALEVSWKV